MRRVLIGTAAAAATAAATAIACKDRDDERRPLEGCNVPTLSAALPSLRINGNAVVDGVVDQSLLSEVRATAAFKSIPTHIPRPTRTHMRQRPGAARVPTPADDQSVVWPMSALGRFHRREEAIEDVDLEVIERVADLIWPLVVAFFEEDEEFGIEGIYRSELQVFYGAILA